jgi:uncharacterized membrane protein
MVVKEAILLPRRENMISGNLESLQSAKNLERLSKKQSNNRATYQSVTVDRKIQPTGGRHTMGRIALLALWVVASVLATSAQVSYTFTTLDVPDSTLTRAHGINNYGDVVGLFQHNGGHGFLLHNRTYTHIDFPGGSFTSARGINSSGTITGGYEDSNGVNHGFILVAGKFTSFDFPGATFTDAYGINNAGDIVGDYIDSGGVDHGFLLKNGSFSSFDAPGAPSTDAKGINDPGTISGVAISASGTESGFLLKRGASRPSFSLALP